MKKYVFMLVAIVAAMSLTSCKGEKGDPGMNVEWCVFDVTVNAADWQYTESAEGSYFRYLCDDVPELTDKVLLNGFINVYIYLKEPDSDTYYQRQLPYVRHKKEYGESPEEDYVFTETYDYEFGRGWVEFQYRASDFVYENSSEFDPPTQQFRVVINW
ncbi:MAG: hypothetical protein MJZ65_00085 [Paludibacteraceae bacterium]|nr:hypothetical protein [Paludibacteraceae bacterium]